jgi:hypothetical protein
VLQLLDNFFDGPLEGIVTDWAFLACLDHSAQKLLPVKWFVPAVSLNHPQFPVFDLFVGRKTVLARQALATSADCRARLRRARVDYLVFKVSAFWAPHFV